MKKGLLFIKFSVLRAGSLLPALTLLFICLLPSCSNKPADLQLPKKVLVPEEATQVESYMSEGGKIKGKLTAPFMLRFMRTDSPYAEFPRSLHVDFYKDSVKGARDSLLIESQLDALYGKYLQSQNKVYLKDSVVVKNILTGDTVHCLDLWWDQRTERFTTDKAVRIYTKDKILFGIGMESDQNFRWYTIRKMTGSILTSENSTLK